MTRFSSRKSMLLLIITILLTGVVAAKAPSTIAAHPSTAQRAVTAGRVNLPGTLEAENYRNGGQGVGYHDSTRGNSKGQYRTDDVDIQKCTDGANCYNVTAIAKGEWLAYDVNVRTSGQYVFTSRVATPRTGKSFHIEVDNVNVSGRIAVPVTNGWDRWTNVTSKAIALKAGNQTIKVVADSNLFNLNWISVQPASAPAPGPSPTPTPPAQKILWSANHDAGNMTQWYGNGCGGEFNSGTGTSAATNTVARSGGYAARLRITNTDSAQQGSRLVRWCELDARNDAYFSAWYYLPQKVTVNYWWAIMQWKSISSSQNFPMWMLNVGNRPDGQMYVYLYDWQNRVNVSQSQLNLPVGRWVHIEGYYRKATNGSGQVTIWQDGTQILNVTGARTMLPGGRIHWSAINYGEQLSPVDVTTYVDDVVISTTRTGP